MNPGMYMWNRFGDLNWLYFLISTRFYMTHSSVKELHRCINSEGNGDTEHHTELNPSLNGWLWFWLTSHEVESVPLWGHDHKPTSAVPGYTIWGGLHDSLHRSRLTPPCPCSWKRSWRNAKWPITASRCASYWRRYRRTAATSQDGDRRPPSEWPMLPLWWVRERGCLSCSKSSTASPKLLFPFTLICFSCQFVSSVSSCLFLILNKITLQAD